MPAQSQPAATDVVVSTPLDLLAVGAPGCVVPVQLDPYGLAAAKGALEGQRVGGAVLQVWRGEVDTKLSLLSLCVEEGGSEVNRWVGTHSVVVCDEPAAESEHALSTGTSGFSETPPPTAQPTPRRP